MNNNSQIVSVNGIDNSNIDEFFISMYFDELNNESKEELRKNLATLRQRKMNIS